MAKSGSLRTRAVACSSSYTLIAILASGGAAFAQSNPILLPTLFNVASQPRQVEQINTASEELATGEQINSVPFGRPGEALEVVPGLIVSQHSGEGKANQYYLRGFNLDHGTDLAITVEGMPLNMRTHGHGQGYADINFLIPELIQSMRIRKGPYFTDEGDFSSAGALHIDYLDKFQPGLAQVTLGSFGYGRGLAARSVPAGAGTILAAAEVVRYNGPWETPDNVRKYNGLIRYSQGAADNGFSILGMAYTNRWTSTDQVAQRNRYRLHRPLRDARSDRRRALQPLQSLGPRDAHRGQSAHQPGGVCDLPDDDAVQQLHLLSE